MKNQIVEDVFNFIEKKRSFVLDCIAFNNLSVSSMLSYREFRDFYDELDEISGGIRYVIAEIGCRSNLLTKEDIKIIQQCAEDLFVIDKFLLNNLSACTVDKLVSKILLLEMCSLCVISDMGEDVFWHLKLECSARTGSLFSPKDWLFYFLETTLGIWSRLFTYERTWADKALHKIDNLIIEQRKNEDSFLRMEKSCSPRLSWLLYGSGVSGSFVGDRLFFQHRNLSLEEKVAGIHFLAAAAQRFAIAISSDYFVSEKNSYGLKRLFERIFFSLDDSTEFFGGYSVLEKLSMLVKAAVYQIIRRECPSIYECVEG